MRRFALLFVLALFSLGVRAQGTIVLAGGAAEGSIGQTSSWSYRVYGALLDDGDRDGDGTIRVAVVARETETAFIPSYFEWIGTTRGLTVDAFNVTVGSRAMANDPAVVGAVATADVVFLKGGDQGEYYDLWNETLLETHIRAVGARGGALGGTSAGAMSLAEHCLCGGQDLIGSDVMADARSPVLDDDSAPGTSSLHSDFLAGVAVPGVYVETHATARGRLGRVLGVLAKLTDDTGDDAILAIALDERTGVIVRGDTATVMGQGAVEFVHQTPGTIRLRDADRPPVYTDLRLDRLTEGWQYVLSTRTPVTDAPPPGVETVTPILSDLPNAGALTIFGGLPSNEQKFEWIATYAPTPYSLAPTTLSTFVRDAVAFTNIDRNDDHRGDRLETTFRALYDRPDLSGFLLYGAYAAGGATGGQLTRTADAPDVLTFAGDMAGIVVDARTVTHRGLAPTMSAYRVPATALVNVRLHVLAESALRGIAYDSRRHALVGSAVAAEGTPDAPRGTLRVTPNPAPQRATVTLEGLGARATVEVVDALGRRVLRVDGAGGNVALDTSRLPAGVYVVRAWGEGADGVLAQRLVVAR